MSVRGGVVLAGSSAQYGAQSVQNFVNVGSSVPVQWNMGGRTACVFKAATFGASGVQLQMLGPDGAGLPVASAFVASQIFTFDAPAGTYVLSVPSGSSNGVYASLVAIPYNL